MTNLPIVTDNLHSHIYTIRGVQVMLDEDLAILYNTSTMRLNQAVKRNLDRFPEEFCFQLTRDEYSNYGGRRKLLFVFTEQGIALWSYYRHQ